MNQKFLVLYLVFADFLSFFFGEFGFSKISKNFDKKSNEIIFLNSLPKKEEDKLHFLKFYNYQGVSNFQNYSEKPIISATSAILMIPESGEILYAKNISEKRSVGSLGKIFIALYSIKKYQNLNQILEVPKLEIFDDESQVGLFEGDRLSVKLLLRDLLVSSGNDSAWTLSGGFRDEISKKFIDETNLMIKKNLNLENTNLVNPSGIDEEGQFSTAYDIAMASFYLIQNETLKNFVNTSEYTAETSKYGVKKFYNTNQLLSYPYLDIRGIKTGTTDFAGPSLSAYARLSEGSSLICVVLNSENRFQECKNLLTWGSNLKK